VRAVVWVSAWEQDCCGEEVAVGDEVRWPALPVADGGPLAAVLARPGGDVVVPTHAQDRHECGSTAVAGVVVGVTEVRCDWAPAPGRPGTMEPVPGSARLRAVERVPGSPASLDERDARDSPDGWLVELA